MEQQSQSCLGLAENTLTGHGRMKGRGYIHVGKVLAGEIRRRRKRMDWRE
jgi:hypothetical protein